MQRMFVAVETPADVRSHLVERLRPQQSTLPGWRWSDPERWHLTLAFLGDVDELTLGRLSERLRRAGRRHGGFDVGLGTLGAFSRPARAQVLWLGVSAGREELVRLAASVAAAGRRCGISLEDRSYRPHLTLARRRGAVDVRDQVRHGASLRTPTWWVDSFVLVESHLGPRPRHEVLERFDLGQAR